MPLNFKCLFILSLHTGIIFADLQQNLVILTWIVEQMKKLKLTPSTFVW